MEIEFDPAKDAANRDKHGVPLAFGARVIADHNAVYIVDARLDYGEQRINCLGMVEGRVFIATWCQRGEVIRFISVRRANPREQRKYHQAQV